MFLQIVIVKKSRDCEVKDIEKRNLEEERQKEWERESSEKEGDPMYLWKENNKVKKQGLHLTCLSADTRRVIQTYFTAVIQNYETNN